MNVRHRSTLGAALILAASTGLALSQQGSGQPSAGDMAEMMKKAAKYTQPGPHHELLARFLGRWETETRITMTGAETQPEKGTAEWSWLHPGRWLQMKQKGTLMGMPLESFWVMGYDNTKMSYVASSVSTFDTAMNYAEGDLDPKGDALILYGTVDEYLTGEHDKMVKVVYRLVSPDRMIQEIHDLPIGENNTKVIEVVWTRRNKES